MTETTDRAARVSADLEWAINSPEPCALPAILPWHEQDAWFARWVRAADNPVLPELAHWQGRRLGKYFEALWQGYLAAHPDWQLRLDHFPVYEEKRTRGELDFVLEHVSSRELLHLELAVKFFLYVPAATPPGPSPATRPEPGSLQHWVGPSLQDSLARKYHHLTSHQLPLGRHPAVIARLGRAPDRSQTVLKGRFFVPWHPALPETQPQWLTWHDAHALPSRYRVWPLPRNAWLTGAGRTSAPQSLQAWLTGLQSPTVPAPQPAMVQLSADQGSAPVWRCVVPDDWPARARAMIRECDPLTGRPTGPAEAS